MKVIGITGSIGAGKSTLAYRLSRQRKIPLFDADKTVFSLCQPFAKGTQAIQRVFPTMVQQGSLDKGRLRELVLTVPEARKQLEKILHPFVFAERQLFYRRAQRQRRRRVLVDIPLLFETGAERECTRVFLVTAPSFLRWKRVQRRGRSREQFNAITAAQWPDSQKRKKKPTIIPTGAGLSLSYRQAVVALYKK
jgi:dephospho-CoA kinase